MYVRIFRSRSLWRVGRSSEFRHVNSKWSEVRLLELCRLSYSRTRRTAFLSDFPTNKNRIRPNRHCGEFFPFETQFPFRRLRHFWSSIEPNRGLKRKIL